ncbi:MAG: ATP-binding protein [Clostridia bacterium]|nr:ATP-binding protein [Clostridia bacterium]
MQKSRIIRNTFYIQLSAYIISELTHMIGNIVDGVIIGRYLGVDSMAAFGIVSPIMVVFALIGAIVQTGSRNRFTRLLGEGKTKEAQQVFSLSFLLSIIFGVALMIVILIFSTPITIALGASGHATDLLPKARSYLIGISFGLPAINAMKILHGFLPIDNDRRLPMLSSLALTVSDIILDLIAAFVLHGDTLEMGVATSVSYYVAFTVLLLHFRKKNIVLKISAKRLPWKELPGIIIQGIPIGICLISFTVRVAFMNQILASVAAAPAIAAYSIYQQADDILCCLTIGMADTVAVIAGILMGEEDRPKMKRLLFTSVQATLLITLGAAVMCWFAAPHFCSLYIQGSAEAYAYATRAVRTYAVGMPLYGLSLIYFNYFQGIGRSRLSSVCGFLSEAGFLMLSAFVMSRFFRADAVWFSLVVTQILMYILYAGIIAVESRRNGTQEMSLWDRVLLLPSTFDVPEEDRIDLSISSKEEVVSLSNDVYSFCESHGCDKRRTCHMSLAVEEMAGNVIQHGFPHDNRKHSVEIRVLKKGEEYVLRIRDDCFIFDPVGQLTMYTDEDKIHHIGLRMTIYMSKDVRYTSILKLNNLLVRI